MRSTTSANSCSTCGAWVGSRHAISRGAHGLWRACYPRVEQQQQGPKNQAFFRLTEKGLDAKKSLIPTGPSRLKPKQ
jgi:hypothetical protein